MLPINTKTQAIQVNAYPVMEIVLLVMGELLVIVFLVVRQIRQLMELASVCVLPINTKTQAIQVNAYPVMEIVLLVMGELLVIVFLVVLQIKQ